MPALRAGFILNQDGLFTIYETGTPKISLKYVNNKTGVKITISKTAGADAYCVYIKGRGDSYADYWSDYDKTERWRKVAEIEMNGMTKRTYTIKGLPKGTYSIKVAALTVEEDGYFYYSEDKTVKIKAPSKVKAEEKNMTFQRQRLVIP